MSIKYSADRDTLLFSCKMVFLAEHCECVMYRMNLVFFIYTSTIFYRRVPVDQVYHLYICCAGIFRFRSPLYCADYMRRVIKVLSVCDYHVSARLNYFCVFIVKLFVNNIHFFIISTLQILTYKEVVVAVENMIRPDLFQWICLYFLLF